MQKVATALIYLLTAPVLPGQNTAAAPKRLRVTVVEDEGAISNVRQRVVREPIVQVEDENHKPIAGAVVVFTLPSSGASVFGNGAKTLTILSDNAGRAAARGLQPGDPGKLIIRVNASFQGQAASTTLVSNVVAGTQAGVAVAGMSTAMKVLLVVGAAGLAATAGVVVATHTGGSSPGKPITITPGTGTVGPPR